MLRNKLNDIFHKVQQNVSCHQKYRLGLQKLYKEVPFEDFEIEFMRCIEVVIAQDVSHKNVYVERTLEFIGSFIALIVNEPEIQNEAEENNSGTCATPFFETILYDILGYHKLESVSARFRTCQLIYILLSNLGDNVSIDSDVWDSLIDPLLERLKDAKPNVRVQASRALARLQTPNDPNCQVVTAFLDRLYDVNSQVRKEIVHLIAPTKITVHKIAERVRDTDHNVRLAAFRKCSVMGPKVLPINMRQSTLNNGFNERNVAVKNFFTRDLLQSWLNAYDGDYLKFLAALKLDSSEEDLKQSESVCKNVLKVFFKFNQLMTIIEHLPIDENKVIPINQLNYQSALYWCTLVHHLHEVEDSEDYLSYVVPDLLPFCVYIENVIQENQKLEGWKYLEYQHNLTQLFQIAGQFDLTDEVGRKALHKLVIDLLTKTKLNEQVIKELITILALLNPNIDSLTTEICHLISDIREPLVEQQPSEDQLRERNFKLAELRVKINFTTEDCTEAATRGDFDEAKSLREKLTEYKKQFEELNAEFNTDKNLVRQTQNDPESILRCLDILIGMLSYPKLKTLTISLRTCKDEFVTPLREDTNPEIHFRAYKCLMIFCTLDKALTQQNLKLICSPVLFYRFTPHENTRVLLISIAAISDILRLFGGDILKPNEDSNKNNVDLTKNQNATRRLYTIERIEDAECIDFNLITSSDIIDTLLEMLDDEREEVRNQTGRALCELVIAQITLSPIVMSKLILKWLISSTEKDEIKLQQLLGNTLLYIARTKDSGEVFERTVIPVLTSIGNAPRASPLADIDVDNAMRFLAAITSVQSQTGFVNVHKNLAYALCYKILNKPEDKCVPLYIKMLLNLNLVLDNDVVINELITQTELILEEIAEKTWRRNIQKFLGKLKLLLSVEVNNEESNENNTEDVPSQNDVEARMEVEVAVVRKSVSGKDKVATNQNDNVSDNSKKIVDAESEKNSNQQKNKRKKNKKGRESESIVDGDSIGTTSKKQQNKKNNTPKSVTKAKVQEDKRSKSIGEVTASETTNHSLTPNIRTSGRLRNKNNSVVQNQEQDKETSKSDKSKTQTVKRRKQRGRNVIDLTNSSFSDETIMHTIVHSDDMVMDKLEDDEMTILTPTTSDSQLSTHSYSTRSSKILVNNVAVTETSSDSDTSQRKSRRSSRNKKRKVYIP